MCRILEAILAEMEPFIQYLHREEPLFYGLHHVALHWPNQTLALEWPFLHVFRFLAATVGLFTWMQSATSLPDATKACTMNLWRAGTNQIKNEKCVMLHCSQTLNYVMPLVLPSSLVSRFSRWFFVSCLAPAARSLITILNKNHG